MGLETNKVKYKESWELVKLSELCTRISDGVHFKPEYLDEGIPFISVKDIYNDNINFDNCKYISIDTHKELIKRCYPEKDDVLITKSGTIGRMALVPEKPEFSLFVSVALIKNIKQVIDSKFLKFCLENFLNHINVASDIKGGLLKNFHLEDIRQTIIPKILISEQHAIVSKIEELFSELDKGIAELKTAQQQLKTYRQSVLNSIVNDKNLNSIESVIEKLDQGWSPKCLNEKSKSFNEWAVIKTSAVQFGRFNPDENKILPKNVPPKEQHEILAGDILITRAGPRVRVGVCCLVKKTRRRLINCDKVYRIKVRKEIILPEFFELILNTPFYQDEIEVMKSGISDSGLNLTQSKFLKIKIPLPPIEEQHRIVQEIESRLSVADKMEQSIQESLQKAEALRQSILKKAFCGELV